MEFLKSLLVGIVLIFLLVLLLGYQISRYSSNLGGIAAIIPLMFIVPLILLISIIIGIRRQTNKQIGSKNNEMKIGKGIYIITLIILLIFFFQFILPSLRFP